MVRFAVFYYFLASAGSCWHALADSHSSENIARRAGLPNWQDFDLHHRRKTGATKHHEAGVSVRKIQAWLGHERLEVTPRLSGVEDAADESSHQQVNHGALVAFV